ncbi:hypothetical protein B0H15DRAFT_801581 [Mycena belliarum]|uniref:Uncharacterized protein n=1 Tax=Mycena belliarum TaxID=1033014 RepID=A0AAD6XR20_9AGAR|nr:hypothetical protein B0H15DRAFT_801581 [Mycena belliae]
MSAPAAAARRALNFERVRTRIVVDRTRADLPDAEDDGETPDIRDWLDRDESLFQTRRLSTLNPAYLQPADYTSFSFMANPSVSFLPHTSSCLVRYFIKDKKYQLFPKGTRGFLYYHSPRHLPPMAGGIRFRVTPSSNPWSFADGADLLQEGLPWEISLHSIASATGRTVLRDQLLHEGLVSRAELDHARALVPQKKRFDARLAVYRLRQPFPVAFDRGLYLWAVGPTHALPWTYAQMFADNRRAYRPLVRPYTGSAVAQFELSPLPEHAGTATVVMRILRLLAAPACVLPGYDGYLPPPAEGALVARRMGHARGARLQPWACDVGAPSESESAAAAALRLLVENTRGLAV